MGGGGRLLGVWAQQVAQEAVGARGGERISGRFGVLAWLTVRLQTSNAHLIYSHCPSQPGPGGTAPP
eukprot:1645997-Prymnesium_polylepis.1